MTLEQIRALVEELRKEIERKNDQISRLLHNLDHLQRLAGRSEKRRPEDWIEAMRDLQGVLPFRELQELELRVAAMKAEAEAKKAAAKAAAEQEPRKERERRGRRSQFPDHLPHKITRHELAEDQRVAPCGGKLEEIGIEITKELERISVTFVHEHHVVKYACLEHPEEGVKTAAGRPPIIEGGLLGPSMLGYAICERFENHMPYHRQERTLAGEGVSLSRSWLRTSALRCAELLEPVFVQVAKDTLDDDVVHLDDTSVVVRNGPTKGREIGHVWAYCNQKGLVFFDYTPNRSRDGPLRVLGSYRGYVQGDALSAHNALFVDGQREEVGCWAHARRKFIDAEMTDVALAKEAIGLIGELYEVEKRAKLAQMNATELGQLRATESKPILARIRDWLDLTTTKVLPQSPIAKGIGYCRNQWQALCRFADDGRIRDIDNNSAERALRAVALGRKNWLFIGAEERAHHIVV